MDAGYLNINSNNIIQSSVQKQNPVVKSEQLQKDNKPEVKNTQKENFDQVISGIQNETQKPVQNSKPIEPKNDSAVPQEADSKQKAYENLTLDKKLIPADNQILLKLSKPVKSISVTSSLNPELFKGKLPGIDTGNKQVNPLDMKKLLSSLQKYTDDDINELNKELASIKIKQDEPKISTLNNMPIPLQADKDLLISSFTKDLNFNAKSLQQPQKEMPQVDSKKQDTKQNSDLTQQKIVTEDPKAVKEAKLIDGLRRIEELIYGTPITKQPDTSAETQSSGENSQAKVIQKYTLNEVSNLTANIAAKLPEGGNFSAVLHLKPESLGSVLIEMTLSNNLLNLSFKADSPEAARVIESQIANLTEKLSHNGIQTQSVEVGVGDDRDMTKNYQDNHQRTAKDDREAKEEILKSYKLLHQLSENYTSDKFNPGSFLRMMKLNNIYN